MFTAHNFSHVRQLGNGRVRQGLVALSKIATKTMLILITESYPVGKTYTL